MKKPPTYKNLDQFSDAEFVRELPDAVSEIEPLAELQDTAIPDAQQDPATREELRHRDFDASEFWRAIPAFADIDAETFRDAKWQLKNTVRTLDQLTEKVGDLASEEFLQDVRKGMGLAPMLVSLSPYLLSRIDWAKPYTDPIRRQFLPVASTRLPDHPMLSLDSLHEQSDSPTPGLVHRYRDKVLFLALDVCPVYCRFCTRSYAIGGDSGEVEKMDFKNDPRRWKNAFAYLAARPEVEDVVISGGDAYMLQPPRLKEIGETLLAIPHIRRIRLASKGPAVMPMKILTDEDWTQTLMDLVDLGRKLGKEVCLHTHFNTPNEISAISLEAMQRLFRHGVTVRNQAVMIRGVNDDVEVMKRLVKMLSAMNVQPYYVYQHDMVKGVEELRTRVADTQEIERGVRGSTAGFNTPTFVTDVPGGGGKRCVHSFDYYDKTTGVTVYRSPAVDADKAYLYFDPIDRLPREGRERWADAEEHQAIIDDALQAAGLSDYKTGLPTPRELAEAEEDLATTDA